MQTEVPGCCLPAHVCRDATGKSPAFFSLTNSKVFLCMVGHMSWGQRFEVVGYEAYDIVRGATLFGQVRGRS